MERGFSPERAICKGGRKCGHTRAAVQQPVLAEDLVRPLVLRRYQPDGDPLLIGMQIVPDVKLIGRRHRGVLSPRPF